MAFVARQFIYPFSSGPSVGINSVMANSRPSIRYELIHSLNRPRFTVCPGQTWNVAPTRNEKFMSFQRPDWHVCPLCQSGLWRSGSKVSSFEMIAGNNACGKYVYSKAYCPAGKQLISGGYQLSNWNGGNGWNTPDISMPSASENAWQIVTGGGVTGGTCMRAIAWCAKN